MTSDFRVRVQEKIEPLLNSLGFSFDGADDSPDPGGLPRSIVYYRSQDCKLQIFSWAREGEVNCMIAPLHAANEFGVNGKNWYYITYFSKQPDIPSKERLRQALAELEAYEDRLDWLRDRIAQHYEAAHAAILEKFGDGQSV